MRGSKGSFYSHFYLLRFYYGLILLPNKLLWEIIKLPYLSNLILKFWCNIKKQEKLLSGGYHLVNVPKLDCSGAHGVRQWRDYWGPKEGEMMDSHRVWEFVNSQQHKFENQNGAWLSQTLKKAPRNQEDLPHVWNQWVKERICIQNLGGATSKFHSYKIWKQS